MMAIISVLLSIATIAAVATLPEKQALLFGGIFLFGAFLAGWGYSVQLTARKNGRR